MTISEDEEFKNLKADKVKTLRPAFDKEGAYIKELGLFIYVGIASVLRLYGWHIRTLNQRKGPCCLFRGVCVESDYGIPHIFLRNSNFLQGTCAVS